MTAEPKKEESKMPNVVVAGGAGFIGAHLCEALLSQNYRVYCIDNLSTGSKENIKDFLTDPNFNFIEADITQPLEIFETLEKIDCIFHLAAIEPVGTEKNFSLETLLVNSQGTKNLLEAAKKFNSKFILVSSGDIYQGTFSSNSFKYYFGEGKKEIIMSQHEAKRFAEALTVEFNRNYQVPATIVRVLDVYGPKMNLGSLSEIGRLIALAKAGENLVVKGDGLQTLNPTYVSDVVFGLIKVAAGDYSGEIFNLINPEKTTVMGLAETIKLISGKLEIVNNPSEEIEFPPTPLDLESSQERLKWRPRVNLAEGLSSTFQGLSEFKPAKILEVNSILDEPLPREELLPKKSNLKRNFSLRLLVFSFSLALVLLTTVLPFMLFLINARNAADNLAQANSALKEERLVQAEETAQKASEQARNADQNLNNIRWFFQLTGQRDFLKANEKLTIASENNSNGIRLLSQVLKSIIEAETLVETDQLSSQKVLEEAKQNLVEARQNLDLAKVNLDQIEKNSLAATLGQKYEEVKTVNSEARQLTQELSESLNSLAGE